MMMLSLFIISLLVTLSRTDTGNYEEEYQPSNYYYDGGEEYGYDHQCNCDEICGGQEPEDWEFEYEEVPPCIINNCGAALDTCASADSCVEGIEGVVSSCYADNEDPMQCMDGLVQDTENNGFNQLCDGNEECGTDLQALGECVVNSANYGFCPEDEYKKIKLKSVLKTIKKRSRKLKRKSAAAKQKSKRSKKSKKGKKGKGKGKRSKKSKKGIKKASEAELKQSSRRLQEEADGPQYEHEDPEYDYGCYCDCGEEEEEIPPCIIDNCGEQLYACGSSEACISGVEGVVVTCYEDNDSPQECMDELMQEANGQQAIDLCDGNEEAAGDLQALGTCVINSANYGFCSEDEYKKLKIKALVKATKKVRARKVAAKQRRARSSKRARSVKARSQRQRKRGKPRSRVEAQRLAKSQRARAQRARKLAQRPQRKLKQKLRSNRRKLQSEGGCCECTESSTEPYCNDECDNTICSYDPYCCNEDYGSWDWICANSAVYECDAKAGGGGDDYDFNYEFDYYEPPTASGDCCECTESSDGPNCNDGCDANICSYDPYCCNNKWDWICANSAKDECAASGNTFEGEETNPPPGDDQSCCDCTETEDGVGCSANPECETIVCPLDSYCCNVNWDGICANGANNICNAVDYWSWEQTDYGAGAYDDSWYQDSYDTYNEGTTGSCCECTSDSDGPGCNAVCDNEVCPLDPYCCNNKWDWICANGASNICQGYDYFNSGGYGYDSYQDSYDFNYGYTPSYNTYEYSNYEPYDYSANYGFDSYSYNTYDSFNNYEPYYGTNSYDYYQPSYDYSDNYQFDSYSYYSPSGEFTYSNEPYYNSEEYSYYTPSYNTYDSFINNYEPYYGTNSYDYYQPSDNYQYDSYSYYSPSGEFTYSNEPYFNSEEYSFYDGTAGQYNYYGAGGYDYYGSGDEYGYDDQCNCDEICYGQEPEDWEFEYEEVPPCIINNCGQQLDTCAYDDSCVQGIEGMVSSCYAENEDPMQCMDGLVQDTENNGFNQLCDGNEQCGADLNSLGECVVNSANYGFCPEEEYKKLKLKSVLKTVKRRSRKQKRKSAAAKQKLRRKSKRSKKRGKRASKLRKSRRKLQEDGTAGSDYYYNDYENPEYDYGCYCDCGKEEEEIPPCIIDNCGEQLYACGSSEACIAGVEGVVSTCYEDNDSPQQCMDELMQEANGQQAIELCNGDESAAGDLQALGTCVINSANYGFCSEDEYKKLKIKALVKATKKVRARKVASKQRKARSSKRARSVKARRKRSRKAVAQRQRRARAQKVRAQRSRKAQSQKSRKARKSRRKLQSVGGCCECTESSGEPYCNDECDNTICSYDPYCCNEEYGSWDWICANAAVQECDGTAPSKDYDGCDSYQGGFEYDYPPYDFDYGKDFDSYYNYEPSSDYKFENSYDYGAGYDGFEDSYDFGGYEPTDSYQFEDSYYEPNTGGDYGGYDGDSYQIENSYDFGDYDGGYDTGFDSYYPPKGRSKRVRSRARSQRQRRQRPRVSKQQRKRSSKRGKRQRRARPVKRQRVRRTRN